jgi:hypothetical protein
MTNDTLDYYSRHFKDRAVGILKEYEAKGVKAGYLVLTAAQRPLTAASPDSPWEGSQMDELSQFRDLAYHVDSKDNVITF